VGVHGSARPRKPSHARPPAAVLALCASLALLANGSLALAAPASHHLACAQRGHRPARHAGRCRAKPHAKVVIAPTWTSQAPPVAGSSVVGESQPPAAAAELSAPLAAIVAATPHTEEAIEADEALEARRPSLPHVQIRAVE
jgi:hypothetical protein